MEKKAGHWSCLKLRCVARVRQHQHLANRIDFELLDQLDLAQRPQPRSVEPICAAQQVLDHVRALKRLP